MERITNISAWSLIFSKLPGVAYNELMSCRGPWFVVRSGRTQLLKKNQKKSLKVKIKIYDGWQKESVFPCYFEVRGREEECEVCSK